MKVIRNISMLSIAALVLSSFAATASFADRGHGYGHGSEYHPGNGYDHGFFDGILAAFASSYSTLTTGDTSRYEADTLIQSAAIYEADGMTTPVFESFVGAMSMQMAAQVGADQMSKVDSDTLHHMVAERILKDAK